MKELKTLIGIPVRENPAATAQTVARLRECTRDVSIILLGDGVDAGTHVALEKLGATRVLAWERTFGGAACFNRLVRFEDADLYVLLENGARVAPRWLEHLKRALSADARHGLAGPSTNLSWNEQLAFANLAPDAASLEQVARDAEARFGDAFATLAPLHSLAEFCYAVTHQVVQTIGAADEGYGDGPCWEMDYNIRAARAGLSGIWVKAAVVWRMPQAPSLRNAESRRFLMNKRRYQDHFCGLRLRAQTRGYDAHCTGEACPHFAPRGLVVTRRAFPPNALAPSADPVVQGPPPAAGLTSADAPRVSCIMPTADRRAYVGQAIAAFLSQDYENRELVIIDDGIDGIEDLVPSDERIHYVRRARGQSLGAKRNEACRLAHGEIIVHWDDDDWHAPWRLSYQVGTLVAEQADICGLDRLWFFDPENKRAWQYRYHGRPRWLAGGTFCYRKSVWQRHPFANVSAGEDTRFVREAPFRKVLALTRDDFYVARIHARNTCRKQTGAPSWFAVPREHVERLIEQGRASSLDVLPLVSCIMPTADRGPFVELALGRFAEQDYVNKELIIVDDGVLPVQALAYGRPGVRYLRLPARQTIGEKRNLACSLARGEYIVQWDDDDWYGPLRLAHQVAPLQAGEADITGLRCRWLATLPDGGFWQMTAALHRRMFVHDVHGGTLAWRKRLWDEGLRYPAANLAEDAALLREAVRRGARLQVLENRGDFVYCRHGANAWNFVAGQAVDPRQWLRIERPPQLAEATFASYRAALDAQHSMHERPSA